MPFVEIDGRLSWVADSAVPARRQRELIEQAARQLADMVTDEDYVCVTLPPAAAGAALDVVCFRLEGDSWVFDKMGDAQA